MGRAGTDGKKKASKKKPVSGMDALMQCLYNLNDDISLDKCWVAYQMDYNICEEHKFPRPNQRKQRSCRTRNCRENPYCLNRLGLEKLERLKSQQADREVAVLERRDIDRQPCGLVNFGNFCYVNSFLQIWFNDLVFRQCVYNWRPDPDFVVHDARMDVQAVMNTMQQLFLTMQFTPFETASASELIRLLRLDNEQHDVQEFNTLFFDALDRNLERHPNGESIRSLIRSRFEGRMAQTIHCTACDSKRESSSACRSLHLSIEGCNSLSDAIRQFLSPESLIGYKCEGCGRTDSAMRSSKFTDLPPVLIIQFNRYTFDANGRHKKLKTPIQYLRSLPEQVLKPDGSRPASYELSAVMIHQGPNTHCGHYYDLIRSPADDKWFSYNDKCVEEIKPPGVDVERESIARAAADMKECYALIYQRAGSNGLLTTESIELPAPDVVRTTRRTLDNDFAREQRDGSASINAWKRQVTSRHRFLSKIWQDLEVSDADDVKTPRFGANIAFLPTSLLTDILAKEFEAVETASDGGGGSKWPTPQPDFDSITDPFEATISTVLSTEPDCSRPSMKPLKPADMSLCPHDRLSLTAVCKGEAKAVSREAAERLLIHYGITLNVVNKENGLPLENDDPQRGAICRLMTAADICVECVKAMKREATFKQSLEDTLQMPLMREIQARTHNPSTSKQEPSKLPIKDSVWVSHANLQHFKKLALDQMEYAKKCQQLVKQLIFFPENAGPMPIGSDNDCDEPTLKRPSSSPLRKTDGSPNKSQDSDAMDADSLMTDDADEIDEAAQVEVLPSKKRRKFEKDVNGNKNGVEATTNGVELEKAGPSYSSSVVGLPQPRAQPLPASGSGSEEWEFMKESIENNRELSNSLQATTVDSDVVVCDSPSTTIGRLPENFENGSGSPPKKKPQEFNEDLYCDHNELSFMKKRVWVTRSEWAQLCRVLNYSREPISTGDEECLRCRNKWQMEIDEQTQAQNQIDSIYAAIGDVLRQIDRRRRWEPTDLGDKYTHVICTNFIRSFLRDKKNKTNPVVPHVCQECLLCEHGKAYLVFDVDDKQKAAGLPVTASEWRQISEAFERHTAYGRPVMIVLNASGQYTDMCETCSVKHLQEEDRKRFLYPDGAFIYVKLRDEESEEKEMKSATAIKTRREAAKGMQKFKMCSTDRVIELKMKIYEKLKHTPNDQMLLAEDAVLENDMTLAEARVSANNADQPLILIVQQTIYGAVGELVDGTPPRQIERGFRDTALSGL